MSLPSTAALVAIQDAAGAAVNQASGAVGLVTPGGMANFSLQSIAGVSVWNLTFSCPNYPSLHGQVFSWKAGQANLIQVPIPQGDFACSYASTVGDGVQSVITTPGQLVARGNSAVPVQHVARLATQAALAAYTNVAGVLTANSNGAMGTIDGVAPAVGDFVLLTLGAAGADNGLYQVTSLGATGAPYVLTRAPDWTNGAQLLAGTTVEVTEGNTAPATWKVMTSGTSTVGTTSVAIYPQYSGPIATAAGSGSSAATPTTMWVWSIAQPVIVVQKTPGGTVTTQTPTLTAGTTGTGKATLAIGSSDTSVYNVTVINW